jgi:hypothetical protein
VVVRGLVIEVPSPFRLDLTAWALRGGAHNAVDRWDGTCYGRTLVVRDRPVEVSVRQQSGAAAPVLVVEFRGSPAALDDGTAAEARRLLERTLGLRVDLADSFAHLAEAGERSVRIAHLAVRELPTSGTSDELFDAGISARHIVEASHSIGNEA